MNAAAPELPSPKHAARPIEVRVIRGGLLADEKRPRHAKARFLESMRGVGFDLSRTEQACALGFGALFALAALAAILVR